MNVLSACPLRVASLVWQPRPGAFALTVVCKATYFLVPGTAPLATLQAEPHALDAHWSDDPRASLRHAGDLAPFKRRADVLLVGHAYAPGKQPVTRLLARLVAGEVDKEIAVVGDRVLMPDGRLGEPAPFTKMPLRWERAAGGRDTPNPVGVALDAPPDRLGRVQAPNLLPPDAHLESRRDAVKAVGFGPLAPGWPGRLAHLRRHAASWDPLRWHERPLPDDLDAGYFNAAPIDQQASDIPPDARLVLTNLHPEHARLVTSLQPIVPRAACSVGAGPAQEVRLRCDTLSIDTDRGVVSLVWRGVVPLADPAQVGQVVVTAEGAGLPRRAPMPASFAATGTLDPGQLARVELPFAPGSAPSAASQPSPVAWPRAREQFGGTTGLDAAMVRAAVALPFAPTQRASEPVSVPALVALPAPPPLMALRPVPERVPVAPPAAPVAAPEPVAVTPEPEPVGPPPLPVEAYPLERCAGIAASLARRRPDRAATLAQNDLDEGVWEALDLHWAEVMRVAAARGKAAPLRAYDEAYVARLEAERGAITVEEYARIMVAAERGTEKDALAELGLPRGALLRLQRVWLKKMGDRKELGRRVREAVEGAREG